MVHEITRSIDAGNVKKPTEMTETDRNDQHGV